jgi:hypothetical protein
LDADELRLADPPAAAASRWRPALWPPVVWPPPTAAFEAAAPSDDPADADAGPPCPPRPPSGPFFRAEARPPRVPVTAPVVEVAPRVAAEPADAAAWACDARRRAARAAARRRLAGEEE